MARGGARPGAGRKPGTVSEATRRRKEIADEALKGGVSPLDVMLTTMRSLWDQAVDPDGKVVNIGKALQANMVAKDAAAFIHPKLSSVEASVQQVEMTPEARKAEIDRLNALRSGAFSS